MAEAVRVGTVESIWRYPVKSMAGESLEETFVGFGGLHGDRLYAFRHQGAPEGFPYFTGREKRQMVLYRPRFRSGADSILPPHLDAARRLDTDLAAPPTDPEVLALDVEMPDGKVVAIDDPALSEALGALPGPMRSDRAIADCRPVSLFSVQTVARIAEEAGHPVDKRAFRANLYLDLDGGEGFAEDAWVGRTLALGEEVRVRIVDRDPRCEMVTINPDTAERHFDVLKTVAGKHDGKAGIYAAVITEGLLRPGDTVSLAD